MLNNEKRFWIGIVLCLVGEIFTISPIVMSGLKLAYGFSLPAGLTGVVFALALPLGIAGGFFLGLYVAFDAVKRIEREAAKPVPTIEINHAAANLADATSELVDQLEVSTNQVLERVRLETEASHQKPLADPPVDVYELYDDVDDRFRYKSAEPTHTGFWLHNK